MLRLLGGVVFVALVLAHVAPATPAVPNSFTETEFVTGLNDPSAMAFAPDGRLFVAEQGGTLRVVKNGALLPTPFVTLPVDPDGERGLLGVAFDPAFATNQFVYVYYTATTPITHNRVSRFTASGDVAQAGSERIILELDPSRPRATTTVAPCISARTESSTSRPATTHGEERAGVHQPARQDPADQRRRIDSRRQPFPVPDDGQEPRDLGSRPAQPVHVHLSARHRADVHQRRRGADVGGDQRRNPGFELRVGHYRGADDRPPVPQPAFRLHAWDTSTTGCAITGGAFYNPATPQFPPDYVGDYFFADYCSGWIRKLDPANGNTVVDFASGIHAPVDLAVGPDGALYYLTRGFVDGKVFRIAYAASQAPAITTHPASQTVTTGSPVTFNVTASGTPPLTYQWQRNGANIAGATSSSYTLAAVTGRGQRRSFQSPSHEQLRHRRRATRPFSR